MRCVGRWLAVAALAWSVSLVAARAGEPRIHADDFGNLVIYGESGLKRIMVGMGHLAEEPGHGDRTAPRYVDAGRVGTDASAGGSCRYGALLRGRSHMYGLPYNVVPVPVVSCGP